MPLHGSLKKVSENINSPRQNRTSCLRTRNNKDESNGKLLVKVFLLNYIARKACDDFRSSRNHSYKLFNLL